MSIEQTTAPRFRTLGKIKIDENIVTTLSTSGVDCASLLIQLCEQLGNVPYSELSALLAMLKALSDVHQTNHWQASGDSFYGDHLLFVRLYEGVSPEVDLVAEKTVGLGGSHGVDCVKISSLSTAIVSNLFCQDISIPQRTDLTKRSHNAEVLFLGLLKCVKESMSVAQTLTPGVDNMLAAIYDLHESHCYLLRQNLSI